MAHGIDQASIPHSYLLMIMILFPSQSPHTQAMSDVTSPEGDVTSTTSPSSAYYRYPFTSPAESHSRKCRNLHTTPLQLLTERQRLIRTLTVAQLTLTAQLPTARWKREQFTKTRVSSFITMSFLSFIIFFQVNTL